MSQETTIETQATEAIADAPETIAAPDEMTANSQEQSANKEAANSQKIAPDIAMASGQTSESKKQSEPDDIHPYVTKASETIAHEVEDEELDKFLRAQIKPFREEWDDFSDSAKNIYIHMMTSQLLQRKAVATQIMIGKEFKLPEPSAQTKMFEIIKQSQIKPKKCRPVLLLQSNLRPTPL